MSKSNIILDLDLTLICAKPLNDSKDKFSLNLDSNKKKLKKFDPNFDIVTMSYPDNYPLYKRKIYIMEKYYIVFLRPNIQEFLDFVFANFNVSIWTAATHGYAYSIIKNVILLIGKDGKQERPERKLDYIFFHYHCKLSNKYVGENKDKSLTLLWDHFKLVNYLPTNTIIIDDNSDVCNNNSLNSIKAPEFDCKTEILMKDTFLVSIIDVLKQFKLDNTLNGRKVGEDVPSSSNYEFMNTENSDGVDTTYTYQDNVDVVSTTSDNDSNTSDNDSNTSDNDSNTNTPSPTNTSSSSDNANTTNLMTDDERSDTESNNGDGIETFTS